MTDTSAVLVKEEDTRRSRDADAEEEEDSRSVPQRASQPAAFAVVRPLKAPLSSAASASAMFIRRAWRNLRRKNSPYSIAASTDPCGECPSTSCAEQAVDDLQDIHCQRRQKLWSFRRQEKDASCPADDAGCGFWHTSLTTLLESRKSSKVADDVCDIAELAEEDVQWKSGYVKLRCIVDADCPSQPSSDAMGLRKRKATKCPAVPSRLRCGFNGIRRSKARLDLSKPSTENVLPSVATASPQAEAKDSGTDFFESVFATDNKLPSALLPTCVASQAAESDTVSGNLLDDPQPEHPEEDTGARPGSAQEEEEFHLVPEFAEKLSCQSSSFESLPDFQLPFTGYDSVPATSLDVGLPEGPGQDCPQETKDEDTTTMTSEEDIPEGGTISPTPSNRESEDTGAEIGLATNQEPIQASEMVSLQSCSSPEDEDGNMFITLSVVEPLEGPQIVKEDSSPLEIILKPTVVPVECPGVENGSGDATVEVKLLIDV